MRLLAIGVLALVVAGAAPTTHMPQRAYGPQIAFPFTAEDDRDGARYVWFIVCVSGFRYDYIPTSEFPHSARFGEVKDPRSGDIAWWPTHVSLYDAEKQEYLNAIGVFHLSDLKPDFPPPKYYRLRTGDGEKFVDKAPGDDRTAECVP